MATLSSSVHPAAVALSSNSRSHFFSVISLGNTGVLLMLSHLDLVVKVTVATSQRRGADMSVLLSGRLMQGMEEETMMMIMWQK